MKNTLKVFGIIAAVAVIGFSVASCGGNGGCVFDGECQFFRASSDGIANTFACGSGCRVGRLMNDWDAFDATSPSMADREAWLDENGPDVGDSITCNC